LKKKLFSARSEEPEPLENGFFRESLDERGAGFKRDGKKAKRGVENKKKRSVTEKKKTYKPLGPGGGVECQREPGAMPGKKQPFGEAREKKGRRIMILRGEGGEKKKGEVANSYHGENG